MTTFKLHAEWSIALEFHTKFDNFDDFVVVVVVFRLHNKFKGSKNRGCVTLTL